MIGRLQGLLVEKLPPEALIEVNGIGYEVFCPMTSFYELPEAGEQVTVYIHHQVREDAQTLYGFSSRFNRDLFRELLKANGVGPKLALAILSSMSAEQFIWTVNQQDVSTLVKIPGVGKKTAERLVLEMKDRLKNWRDVPATPVTDSKVATQSDLIEPPVDHRSDAIDALIALGYKATQAETVVKKVAQDGMSSESLIRHALKAML